MMIEYARATRLAIYGAALILIVIPIGWFVWDMSTWGKNLLEAMLANPLNLVCLSAGFILIATSKELAGWFLQYLPKSKPKLQSRIPPSWRQPEKPTTKKKRESKAKKTSKKTVVKTTIQKGRSVAVETPVALPDDAGGFQIRIPGLRMGKRILAFVLMIANFIIGEFSLTAPTGLNVIAIFFLLNSFILLDYLWKTRHKKTTVFKKAKK